jgi:hypothetical protein
MPVINVNILIHGLFFMTQEGNNLRIYAPSIPNHHFIGGIRGSRVELSGLQDFSGWGLRGKTDPMTGLPAPNPATDVDGSIMQFPVSAVGAFQPLNSSAFKGTILLPWPQHILGLRTGPINTTFRAKPGTIANNILANASAKNSTTLGVVALLLYTLPALPSVGGVSQLSIHFYLQPGKDHIVKEVNDDLVKAQASFTSGAGFDLEMITGAQEPDPIPASGHLEFGTTVDDEQAVHEERARKCPDIQLICRNDPLSAISPQSAGPQGAVNPANCPIFFVG